MTQKQCVICRQIVPREVRATHIAVNHPATAIQLQAQGLPVESVFVPAKVSA